MDTNMKLITDETTAEASFASAAEKLTSFGKGNIEAIVRSSQIWIAGCHAITETMVATAQSQVERNISNWRALMGVRSLKEATDFRTNLAQEACTAFFAETSEITDASMKLAEEAIAPIAARMTLAAETVTHRPH